MALSKEKEETRLSLFSETEFGCKSQDGFPMSCPTLDLSVTWDSDDRNLLIYRPPDQTVSKIHQVAPPGHKAPEVQAVTWKPDGQFLAVAWSDGVVRLMGLENNKAAHHIPVCDKSETITHIGWATCFISSKKPIKVSSRITDELSDDWHQGGDKSVPLDLPRELTFLEVETALPNLSALPTASAGSGEDATVFTLRTGIEFLFRPPKRETYDQANIMIVGTSTGKLHLSIYDSFVIGTFSCPSTNPSPSSPLHMIHHSSHPRLSTHSLILAETRDAPKEVHLVPMDLPFISFSPINLSLLTSKLTTLQALLRYLTQVQLHMEVEWKNARELPGRFLRSVQGDLEEREDGPRDIVPALYHTVLTGHAHEPVKEWLVDSLAERGHKRWDKAVVTALESLRSLVHQNFLPALERCCIILSRLRGLAKFHDDRDDIGFSAQQISRALEIMSCLTFVGHKILVHTMDELEHFTAFSAWLRFQIDRQASSSPANDELTEKEATMDNARILTYIECYLTRSPLDMFFDEVSSEDHTTGWDHFEDGVPLLDALDGQLKKHEAGQPCMKALPHAEFLVKYVTSWCARIFSSIAEAKTRSVRFGQPMRLSIGQPITKMDVKMCEEDGKGGITYTALASKSKPNKVYIFRAAIEIVNGISSNQLITSACVDLGSHKFIDLKFLNDKTLLLLCNDKDNHPLIVHVPIKNGVKLSYGTHDSENSSESQIPVTSCVGLAEHRLPEEHQQGFRPIRMEVHDRSAKRGEIPARVGLLGSNRTTWRTYKLPA